MATILSSKSFFVDKTAKFPLLFVEEWLNGIDRGTGDLRLTVTLETYGNTRRKKSVALDELNKLLIEPTGEVNHIYKYKQIYNFDFNAHKYTWNGEEIYLTANEELFLYCRLILKSEISERQMFYLRNMRRRLGKEFLTGLEKERNNDSRN